MKTMLRRFTLLVSVLCSALVSQSAAVSQTAPNFSITDCANGKHDLYQDLDAGKAVVIVWVMPCGACAMPTLTTNGVVKDVNKTYPGKVKLYVLDDFGDTECASLSGWLKTYSITTSGGYATIASTSSVSMTDYGAIGMPKIIAVWGADRRIIYRSENDVDGFVLRDSIVARLATSSVDDEGSDVVLSPHPVRDELHLRLGDTPAESLFVDITDAAGNDVNAGATASLNGSDYRISTAHLASGTYVARIRSGVALRTIPFIVIR